MDVLEFISPFSYMDEYLNCFQLFLLLQWNLTIADIDFNSLDTENNLPSHLWE